MEERVTNTMPFSSLEEATGEIPYNMLNDYMFRAVLQSNNKVLCGLIRALLHLPEEIPLKAKITNPILLGESVENKEFRLDINVIINNHTLLNLEMQVANQLNWKNRSLIYLCRSFDQINHGEDYSKIKPVLHIGFLNFTLFKEDPQFYAKYKFMNAENHRIYSDNLELRVLDLTKTELATQEDKDYQIDYWATLFKTKTWEELKMLAKKNEYMEEATNTIFRMSADDLVRKRCRDREDYYSDLRSYEKAVADAVAERDDAVAQRDAAVAQRDDAVAQRDDAVAQRDAAVAQRDNAVAQRDAAEARLKELQKRLEELDVKAKRKNG